MAGYGKSYFYPLKSIDNNIFFLSAFSLHLIVVLLINNINFIILMSMKSITHSMCTVVILLYK